MLPPASPCSQSWTQWFQQRTSILDILGMVVLPGSWHPWVYLWLAIYILFLFSNRQRNHNGNVDMYSSCWQIFRCFFLGWWFRHIVCTPPLCHRNILSKLNGPQQLVGTVDLYPGAIRDPPMHQPTKTILYSYGYGQSWLTHHFTTKLDFSIPHPVSLLKLQGKSMSSTTTSSKMSRQRSWHRSPRLRLALGSWTSKLGLTWPGKVVLRKCCETIPSDCATIWLYFWIDLWGVLVLLISSQGANLLENFWEIGTPILRLCQHFQGAPQDFALKVWAVQLITPEIPQFLRDFVSLQTLLASGCKGTWSLKSLHLLHFRGHLVKKPTCFRTNARIAYGTRSHSLLNNPNRLQPTKHEWTGLCRSVRNCVGDVSRSGFGCPMPRCPREAKGAWILPGWGSWVHD